MGCLVNVVSGDGKVFEVDLQAIQLSKTVKTMLEGSLCFDGEQNIVEAIPLPNVCSAVLEKILLYCEHHKNDVPEEEKNVKMKEIKEETNNEEEQINVYGREEEEEEMSEWDSEFLDVDQSTLLDIILAANYLEIKSLLDIACLAVAKMMKGKSAEEIRRTFNIKNDFTPEEEEQVSICRRYGNSDRLLPLVIFYYKETFIPLFTAMSNKRKVVSSDGVVFEAELSILKKSRVIKELLEKETSGVDSAINIESITGDLLGKVLLYCANQPVYENKPRVNRRLERTPDVMSSFDMEFFNVDPETLFNLISVGIALKIDCLLENSSKYAAHLIRGKTGEDIRQLLEISLDEQTSKEPDFLISDDEEEQQKEAEQDVEMYQEMEVMLNVISREGRSFPISLQAAKMSLTLRDMLDCFLKGEVNNEVEAIPLQQIDSNTLHKVIRFCEHYKTEANPEEERSYEINEWDLSFFGNNFKAAADYLQIHLMSRRLKVISSDGEAFEVDSKAIKLSKTVKTMLEDLCTDEGKAELEPIPLPNVNSTILKKAANYLEIKSLLDVACKTVANMIKGKSPEEIRRTFNIKNDFTPEEEEQIRRENAWCEE
ncbi:S-phase kinase-associated protein 1 [Trichinella murrelli]|uniref:S-phase kinase-associated protein 1 n=1 Tax=Trichinella murrelli TaxID=144512 RepID=A0A0V0T8P4_9BILA|nr:S-phase kinase-associated protein 1 [Trichinella murrelli]